MITPWITEVLERKTAEKLEKSRTPSGLQESLRSEKRKQCYGMSMLISYSFRLVDSMVFLRLSTYV